MCQGFDEDIIDNLKYRNSLKHPKRRSKQFGIIEKIQSNIKLAIDAIGKITNLHLDSGSYNLDFKIPHLNNRNITNMNNLMSIDFATRDFIDDSDYILPRMG